MGRGRKKGLLYPQIETKIRQTVKQHPGASTHEVATKSRVSWATADKYLKDLRREKKLRNRRVGKKSVWF